MSTATSTATSTRASLPTRPVVRPAGRPSGVQVSRPAGLVLTRRGRRLVRATALTVTTTLVAVLLVLAWLGAAASVAPAASAGDGEPGVVSSAVARLLPTEAGAAPVEVVVGPGDTLWQIARSNAPERDPRSVVADIVRINHLSSTAVAAGAVLVVPTG